MTSGFNLSEIELVKGGFKAEKPPLLANNSDPAYHTLPIYLDILTHSWSYNT
jgi:hypothetical protein